MVKVHKCMQTAINTKEIMSTAFAKAVELLHGQMVVSTMVILSKVIVTGMVSGSQIKILIKSIKVITCWIKSMDMESMIGAMDMYTKEITWKIKEMDLGSYFTMMKFYIRGNG